MKYYKIGITLIFFLILSIGAISAESVDSDLSSMDSVDADISSVDADISSVDADVSSMDSVDSASIGSVDADISSVESVDDVQIDDSNLENDIMESQEENLISDNVNDENQISDNVNEEILQDGYRNFSALKNDLDSPDNIIDLYSNYRFNNETDSGLAKGIQFENRNFILDGHNNVIDANNESRVFAFKNSNVTIKDLIVKNTKIAFVIDEGANITTINLRFENNIDPSFGAVCVKGGIYNSFNDTFKNNKGECGSSIFLMNAVATISNASFINDDLIEWALIYGEGDDTVINIMDCDFMNLNSKYATVVYNKYQTSIQRCKFINLSSISAGAIAIKGFPTADDFVPLLEISDSIFINVSSSKNGGAIIADMNGDSDFSKQTPNYGSLIINNTSFDNCSSLFGGAIAQFGGELIINNTNFTNNNATYIGGAVYASNASVNVYSSLFENNTAVKDSFFETGGGSNSLADSFGKFNSGAIYSDSGEVFIKDNNFTKNTGALSLYHNRYYGIVGNVFNDNGIAIKSYFDNDDTEIGTNTYNGDRNSLNNEVYDLNIDETGAEIPYDPIIIPDASADDPSFDLRDWGLVSPVDNQGYFGSCWAFATAGAIESAFLKATNKTLKLNISENNIKGVILAYSIFGATGLTEATTIHEPVSYILSFLGIVNDTLDSYDQLGKVSPIFLNKNTYHIQNVLKIPEKLIGNESQCNEIDRQLKEALVKYGALTVYINGAQAEGDGYNKATSSQYIGDPKAEGNHFVTLVGWDDNYSPSNFAPYYVKDETGAVIETYTVTKPGAWIIKNSWGTDFGDNGFCYVSYEDTTFATSYSVAYIINQTPLYNTVYQYDYDFTGYGSLDDNYTLYFLAGKDEIISAVGTYFNGTGLDYTISVFVGYDDVLAYRQSGKSLYPGYQTIELAKQIAVKKGDQFAISIRTSIAPFVSGSKIVYARGRVLLDGEDAVKYGIMPCLKAYTFSNPLSAKLNYVTSEKFTLTGPAGSTVIVEYDGANTTLTFDSSGKAVLNKALKLGNHMANVYYNGKLVAFPIHVFKSVSITSSVICGYNTHLKIDSFLYDLNDLALKNAYVTVKLDGESYSFKTYDDGGIGITLDNLAIGSHTLTVINPLTKESASCIVKVVSRFSNNKNIAMDYFNGTKYKVRVYGNNGKVVGAGQVVIFKLNKKTYRIKTDKNGWATLSIPYTVVPKKYTVTASYKGQTIKNTITVKRVLSSSNRALSKRARKWVLKAVLKTSKKKPIKGKVVKFKFNGKTYSAKTNKKGIAQVIIKKAVIKKLKKGKKYKVSISYLKDTIKKTITVKA